MNSSPSLAAPAIEISGLSKHYGELKAVDDISLSVADGDFFGFLGPNGAGKTTTINAIVGLASPTAGSIRIFGFDTVTQWREARRLVGIAPQEYNFDRYLSIRDILIFQAGYFGIRGAAVRKRADDLLERFNLSSKSRDTFVRLSGGMKRRLSLARAMIHEPRLLILDEPTAGVDVELRIELWEMLRDLNAGGTTILLTTHYLEEAEALCRTIGIIEGGRLVALETTSGLLARAGESALHVVLDRPITIVPPGLVDRRARIGADGRTISFDGIAATQIGPVLAALEAGGYGLADVSLSRSNLQDVFLELTRR
jgi:ABC-2 type transport system ATP-binding protein